MPAIATRTNLEPFVIHRSRLLALINVLVAVGAGIILFSTFRDFSLGVAQAVWVFLILAYGAYALFQFLDSRPRVALDSHGVRGPSGDIEWADLQEVELAEAGLLFRRSLHLAHREGRKCDLRIPAWGLELSPEKIREEIRLRMTIIREAREAQDSELAEASEEEAPFLRAKSLLREGKMDEAESILREAVSEHPDSVRAHIELGELFLYLKRFEDAEVEFRASIKLEKPNAQARYLRGFARLELGKLKGALKDLNIAVDERPKDPRVYQLRATIYERMDQLALAKADREVLLRLPRR